jgi:two-component system sensor histidine kinase PilS (NtrC family)
VFAIPQAAGGAESVTPLFATVAYLGVLGVLAGMLGERVYRTRADLERTARELDRVRVDNDTVLRHLTTGVLSVDAQGRVSYLNPAAEQVLGVRSLECRGQHVAGAVPQRLAPLRDLVLGTLDTRTPRARVELDMTGPSGRPLPIGMSTNLLLHEGRFTGLVAVFQDLSEVREMERRARRHETLAEIGALSARIAHELRNGLNPISGSVECLQRELRLEGENAVLMGLISRECARLNRFVTDLLNYSRERDLALETLSVDDELGDLGELLSHHPRRPDGVTVSVQPGGEEACVRGDREQLRQVWLNLAANAFEAMAEGGRLVVRRRMLEDDRVVIEFEDTGTGIEAEELSRVGQPFYTTKQGGTGLGLTIASRIVERHGGTLTLESVTGRGTTVRVGLPVHEAVIARAA